MICPSCKEEVTKFKAYQQVYNVVNIELNNEEPYVDQHIIIEFPKGKPYYKFRCNCGGDLSMFNRECLQFIRRGSK